MLVKQAIDISFAQGLDTKTDPKRVPMGSFVKLENTIFTKGGLLQKRNGYASLTALPDATYAYVTTLRDNLTAIGTNIAAYNAPSMQWVSKGSIRPLTLNTLALIRNNLNQTQVDTAIAANGLVCLVYSESDGSTTTIKYAIADSETGQNIVAPTAIPVSSGAVTGSARVFVLGTNFIIVFTNVITATSHLQYVAVSINNPTTVSTEVDLAAAYVSAGTVAWDGVVYGNSLYFAYNTTTGGQAIKVKSLTTSGTITTGASFSGYIATMMTLAIDVTVSNPMLYVSFYDVAGHTGYTAVLDLSLNVVMNPVQIIASGTILNLASAAQNGSCKIFYEVSNNYSFDASIPTHYISSLSITPLGTTFKSVFSSAAGSITASSATGLVSGMTIVDNTTAANISPGTTFTISGTTLTLSHNTAGNSASSPGDTIAAATVTSPVGTLRSVGLASKAFIIDGVIYFLAAYQSSYQPTYFLINGSTSTAVSPVIIAKLAYSNGGGYLTLGLPSVTVTGTVGQVGYLFKDLIQAVNKDTAVASGTQVNGIYSQTGINLASFDISMTGIDTAEIGGDLHISGGFLSMYDGYLPVEHNFFLWPDISPAASPNPVNTNVAVWAATGGAIAAQPDGSTNTDAYFYQVTYEWTDNAGNAFRSAPSIPVAVTTTGSGSIGAITLHIPTLRLTYKVANPVKIVIYRWSVGQQAYYQVTSITTPTLNSTTADSVTFVDALSDATILGNNLLYTTGGVVEDVNAPATNLIALFDNRLFMVDAEDQNLLWYSKQVIEATPVEMSDLFTIFVAPTTASQGPTGPMRAISVMDDKLIIFKNNAIYYINGSGPDNTGANSQYSQPIFITATVGCSNQQSVVFTPQGLMFQSDKGIWLLGRDLQTSYIGAPVEGFNNGVVESAQNIPETNQVRFILDTGVTLMYDYFYGQWGTFVHVAAVSSCIFEGRHTFINDSGAAYQESPGTYVDGSTPVLMSFKTGPIRLDALQSYQRAYFFYLLGQYFSPHKLYVSVFYDYSESASHGAVISPTNYSTPYGSGDSQSPYGQGNPYGGPSNLEQWRVFLERQRCQAFAIEVDEVFDASIGALPGQGLTLSGINLVVGLKQKFKPISAAHSVGVS